MSTPNFSDEKRRISGSLIRQEREARGWTVVDLAEKMGYKSHGSISNLERSNGVHPKHLKKLDKIFNGKQWRAKPLTSQEPTNADIMREIQALAQRVAALEDQGRFSQGPRPGTIRPTRT